MSNKTPSIPHLYMEYCLSGDGQQNVYSFCKKAGINETDFYTEFGSLDAVRHHLFKLPFRDTLEALHKDESYSNYNAQEKILSFFFTWTQELIHYRSFLLQEEKHLHIHFYKQFCYSFYHEFDEYANQVIGESIAKGELPSRQFIDKAYAKALWGQLLFLFKFWLHDTSKGFEQTDAAIEKSVRVAFDLIGNSAIDSVFDFGRFMLGQFQRN